MHEKHESSLFCCFKKRISEQQSGVYGMPHVLYDNAVEEHIILNVSGRKYLAKNIWQGTFGMKKLKKTNYIL